jgi:tetratricopeptide (TPR) repeat protein
VGPIIRTCSAFALVAALGLTVPAQAAREKRSALASYVQARLADSAGEPSNALAGYAAALTAEPDNVVVAFRTFRQAVAAGDKKVAVRAALQLEAAKALPSDARLLLFGERIGSGDIRGARAIVDRMEEEGNFAFAAPILRAWTGVTARDADPMLALDNAQGNVLASSYAPEQRALLLIALKRWDEGAHVAKSLAASTGKPAPMRIAVASALVDAGRKDEAINLLNGVDPALNVAKLELESGRLISGQVKTAQAGAAQLYARIADDLLSERSSAFALTMARFARFLDGRNDYVALTEVRALVSAGLYQEALTGLRAIPMASPFAGAAREAEAMTLEKLGKADEAIAILVKRSTAPGALITDHLRLGEAYERQQRYKEAAVSYASALALNRGADGKTKESWALLMLHGAALERSGQWAEAKSSLRRAVELAPDQPAPHNHLGYAMLERREDIPEATRLIARASALKPDDVAITDSLGWAYYLGGDLERAVAMLEQAVAGDPYEPTLGEHLGDVYWAAGRRIDARYAWAAASVGADEKSKQRLRDKIDIGLNRQNAAR